jgi:hypothetical protein
MVKKSIGAPGRHESHLGNATCALALLVALALGAEASAELIVCEGFDYQGETVCRWI